MSESNTTAAETGRNTNESESTNEPENTNTVPDFVPTEAWIREYQKQATPKLIAGLHRFARTRALAVADAGRKVDDYYARELVLDALGDTWLGVVRWEPAQCTLAYHLVRTIEGRSDKHRKQALARPHDALGDETAASRLAEIDASELVGDTPASITRVQASEALKQIRALAAKDGPVLRILDAYASGCETREEVLAHAKMKNRTYHNAYSRLRRIVRHLADNKLAVQVRA